MTPIPEPRLISSAPYQFTPLEPHVSLHPKLGHLGINKVVQDLGVSRGLIKQYRPMNPILGAAYSELGYLWEDALNEQFMLRQAQTAQHPENRKGAQLTLQKKFCVEGLHMIPDGIWSVKNPGLSKRYAPDSVDEYKLTFTQPPDPEHLLRQKWAWRVVTHCYAKVVGVVKVRFIVCWVGGRIPEPREYNFEYSWQAINSDWDMVLSHRDVMKKKERG